MRKSRVTAVVAWSLLGAATVLEFYDWIVVNEGLRYFAEDHRRILLAMAIGIVGAPILLAYGSLSQVWRRSVDLWLSGSLAIGTTLCAVYSLHTMWRLAGFLRETGTLWMGVIAVLLPCAMAAVLWWVFARIRQELELAATAADMTIQQLDRMEETDASG